jgi:hypothetical protein
MVFFVCFSPYESKLCWCMCEKGTIKARNFVCFSNFSMFLNKFSKFVFHWFGILVLVSTRTRVWCEFLVFFEKFLKKWSEKHEFSEINYSFSRNLKSLVHVSGKNSQRILGTVAFFAIRKFFKLFFENLSKNMKLVIKLLCLSKRQPKYQRVETNIYSFRL